MAPLMQPWVRRAKMTVDAKFIRKEMCNRLECGSAECPEPATWVIGGRRGGRPVSRMLCALHAAPYCWREDTRVAVPAALRKEYEAALEERQERQEEQERREEQEARRAEAVGEGDA